MVRMAIYRDYYLFPEDQKHRRFTWIHLGMSEYLTETAHPTINKHSTDVATIQITA